MTTTVITAANPTITEQPERLRLYPVRDTLTLLRRNVKNQLRDMVAVLSIIGFPVIFLLLFVYVYGGALNNSVSGGGGHKYVNYVLPGIVIMTISAGLIGISSHVATDMHEGIIARFRTMPIYKPAILIARVISYVIQTLISIAIVMLIAWPMGLNPKANALEWLAIFGFLTLLTFALTCLGLAFGLAAKSVASAANGPFPLVVLPLVGSGIVPTNTMPTGVRYFAEYQPFTSMIETFRGLLMGTAIGNNWIIALAWATGIAVLGLWWAITAFNRERPS
jgi:ABC-2 type transport system permease protein